MYYVSLYIWLLSFSLTEFTLLKLIKLCFYLLMIYHLHKYYGQFEMSYHLSSAVLYQDHARPIPRSVLLPRLKSSKISWHDTRNVLANSQWTLTEIVWFDSGIWHTIDDRQHSTNSQRVQRMNHILQYAVYFHVWSTYHHLDNYVPLKHVFHVCSCSARLLLMEVVVKIVRSTLYTDRCLRPTNGFLLKREREIAGGECVVWEVSLGL